MRETFLNQQLVYHPLETAKLFIHMFHEQQAIKMKLFILKNSHITILFIIFHFSLYKLILISNPNKKDVKRIKRCSQVNENSVVIKIIPITILFIIFHFLQIDKHK
jgi:hypothetical protein